MMPKAMIHKNNIDNDAKSNEVVSSDKGDKGDKGDLGFQKIQAPMAPPSPKAVEKEGTGMTAAGLEEEDVERVSIGNRDQFGGDGLKTWSKSGESSLGLETSAIEGLQLSEGAVVGGNLALLEAEGKEIVVEV